MFGGKLLASLFAGLMLLTAACSSGDDQPQPEPSVFAATPVEGGVPTQQGLIAGSAAPRAYPVLTEETGVKAYLRGMLTVNMAALKNRQTFEVKPAVVLVKGDMSCYKVPGAKKKQATHRIGDKAPAKSPIIATCVHDGRLAIMVAPRKFYKCHMTHNVPVVRARVINVTQDYLAQLALNRASGRDGDYVACAGGRLIGGLRDGGYVATQWANIQGAKHSYGAGAEQIFVTARDQGTCPLEAFGQ